MSKSRLELKVGGFVLLGLALMAVLVMLFSKDTTFFESTFELRLKAGNVGGIKAGSNILLSGVPVGRVSGVELDPDGKTVTILLKVFSKFKLYDDARFEIEQFGFLGDQYVAVYPGESKGRQLKDKDQVLCRNPFNMQETVAQAVETISRMGQATTNVNAVVSDVRRLVLTEQRLQDFGAALDHFALLTTETRVAVSNVNTLIATNVLPVTIAVSNLSQFAAQLTPLALNVNAFVTNNEADITAAIKNIETASALLTNLLHELQTGPGLAGRLLRDEQMGSNLAAITSNLAVTTSNLNRGGLWSILWKPKVARTNGPALKTATAPRDPFH